MFETRERDRPVTGRLRLPEKPECLTVVVAGFPFAKGMIGENILYVLLYPPGDLTVDVEDIVELLRAGGVRPDERARSFFETMPSALAIAT